MSLNWDCLWTPRLRGRVGLKPSTAQGLLGIDSVNTNYPQLVHSRGLRHEIMIPLQEKGGNTGLGGACEESNLGKGSK